ncbi:MAG: ABC transporter ATPase [Saprospiraceae bacterium]|nr:ABC transporter ATPase [Saprospiraceae bacterium]
MFLDLIALDNHSKVWIYQSKDQMDDDTVRSVNADLRDFLNYWTSHNRQLYTYGNIFHHRFVTIFVDETHADASGCSIDKSVHFIESLEMKYGLSLFDRENVAIMEKQFDEEGEDISTIYTLPLSGLKDALKEGRINEQTLVFNNLVKTKEEFLKKWIVPLHQSWHKRFI